MTTSKMDPAGAAVVPAQQTAQASGSDADSPTRRAVRQATSCVECQRRKQKCSREWPCDKCRGRKIPHLCRFVANKGEKGDAGFANGSRKRKENPESTGNGEYDANNDFETNEVLRELGYLPGQRAFMELGGSSHIEDASRSARAQQRLKEQNATISEVLGSLDDLFTYRPPVDILVQNFFQGPNYHYYMVYPPQFTEEYAKWWEKRNKGEDLPPAFTAMLLRACAGSLQFLNLGVRSKIAEIGDPQKLTERLHDAAMKVANLMAPGEGGLFQVQQLILMSWWYKSETRFQESWHALAQTYLCAQELGMDRDSRGLDLSEFELEMRRRVWTLLYLWDWQMSALLSRPMLINHMQCVIVIPTLHLENLKPDENNNFPSPFEHIALSADLVRTICAKCALVDRDCSAAESAHFERTVRQWMDEKLVGVFDLTDPDTRYDNIHQYIVWQRKQLILVAYLTGLIPLKRYMVQDPEKNADPFEARRLRAVAVDWCIKLMDYSQDLFDLVYPEYGKYHFSLFCVFDCAAIMCAAVIHDVKRTIPQRDKVIDAITSGLEMMRYLRPYTKVGDMSYHVLAKLVANLPLTPQERSERRHKASKRPKHRESPELVKATSVTSAGAVSDASASTPQSTTATISAVTSPVPVEAVTEPEPVVSSVAAVPAGAVLPVEAAPIQWNWPEIAQEAPLSQEDFSTSNIGEFHYIFDWQGLDVGMPLDYSTPNLQTMSLPEVVGPVPAEANLSAPNLASAVATQQTMVTVMPIMVTDAPCVVTVAPQAGVMAPGPGGLVDNFVFLPASTANMPTVPAVSAEDEAPPVFRPSWQHQAPRSRE